MAIDEADMIAAQQSAMIQPRGMPPLVSMGSIITTITNPSNILYQLELDLRSATLDEFGLPKQVDKPMLNEVGILAILRMTRSVVNPNTHFGNLKDDESEGLRNYLADSLCKALMVNKKKYGIKNQETASQITQIVISFAAESLSRGRGGDDKRFFGKTTTEVNSTLNTQKKDKGILDKLPFIGGKK